MKTALKVAAICVCLFLVYAKQEVKIIVLQAELEHLQFMDSLQSSRIDNLREYTFKTDSMMMEAIKKKL